MQLEIAENFSLKEYNTFGVDVRVAAFAAVKNIDDIRRLMNVATRELYVLGGGSNILFTQNLDRAVIHNDIGGIEIVSEDRREVLVRVGGGVVWHDLVRWAIDNDLGGIENLALIPGRTGAAPIQNIGAYGVELSAVFHHLAAVDIASGDIEEFDAEACAFGYRDSIFKGEAKGKYCITHVWLTLGKPPHEINDSYGAIRDLLAARDIRNPDIRDICETVIEIRSAKLPDPAELGNCGSFFKNPVISEDHWSILQRDYPHLVYYPAGDKGYKIPAGWLIEQCGWKGKRVGNVGCYEKQALVIVNYGGASGQEIYDHAMRVQDSVEQKFGILLTPEVNVL